MYTNKYCRFRWYETSGHIGQLYQKSLKNYSNKNYVAIIRVIFTVPYTVGHSSHSISGKDHQPEKNVHMLKCLAFLYCTLLYIVLTTGFPVMKCHTHSLYLKKLSGQPKSEKVTPIPLKSTNTFLLGNDVDVI